MKIKKSILFLVALSFGSLLIMQFGCGKEEESNNQEFTTSGFLPLYRFYKDEKFGRRV